MIGYRISQGNNNYNIIIIDDKGNNNQKKMENKEKNTRTEGMKGAKIERRKKKKNWDARNYMQLSPGSWLAESIEI